MSLARRGIEFLRGRRDARRLRRALMAESSTPTLGAELPESLDAAYRDYVREVSTPEMAVSREAAGFLLRLCALIEPRRILGLGSGFSCVVFRRYAAGRREVAVTSVDDDPVWLERTIAFLEKTGLGSDRMLAWREFRHRDATERFDLVLHDLGSMELREQALGVAFERVRAGGVLVLDDLQKRSYARSARAAAAARGFRVLSARRYTCDHFGRFCGLVICAADGRATASGSSSRQRAAPSA